MEVTLRKDGLVRNGGCGECTACCTIMAVPPLDKWAGEPCEFVVPASQFRTTLPVVGLRRTGCGVYATRPPCCAAFECLWLRGAVGADEALRPDKVGVMLYVQPPSFALGTVVTAVPVAGAGPLSDVAKEFIDKLATQTLVFLRTGVEQWDLRGPEALLAAAHAKLKEVESRGGGRLELEAP